MAATFDLIVQRVKQQLLGYTRVQESISYLTNAMTDTDITFQVDPETASNLSRGIVEIDDEMVAVKKVDRSTGLVTVFANLNGRGVEGTDPSAHALDAVTVADPRYPRVRIKEAINDTIRAVYPDVWVFGEFEFPYVAARYEYPVPVEVEDVYKVTWNTIGPSAIWRPARTYRFNPQASVGSQVKPTPTPTGKTIQILDGGIVPGRNIRVTYSKKPNVLVNGNDDFELTTGLPDRMIDMITYGACWRMLPSWEAGRLQQQSIEATERAPLVPTGAASDASKYFLGLYQRRMDEERGRLFRLVANYQTFSS